MKDKQVVYFGKSDTTEARRQEVIAEFQKELEAYWKWEILFGNKSLVADSSAVASSRRNARNYRQSWATFRCY